MEPRVLIVLLDKLMLDNQASANVFSFPPMLATVHEHENRDRAINEHLHIDTMIFSSSLEPRLVAKHPIPTDVAPARCYILALSFMSLSIDLRLWLYIHLTRSLVAPGRASESAICWSGRFIALPSPTFSKSSSLQ